MLDNSLQDTIKRYELEEALLQFEHFSHDDALKLGLLLIENAKTRHVKPAFEIIVNGYTVFRYGFPTTNLHNEMWLRRKSNIVNTVHMSSIHVGALLKSKGENIDEDWYLPAKDYAYLGGGFPLILKNTGVVGSICASGLPHEEDHQIVVDTVAQYLDVRIRPDDI